MPTEPAPSPCRPSRLRQIAGAAAFLLLSFVLNDPRQPAPLAWAAAVVALIGFGKFAGAGLRWLVRESAVAFAVDLNPIPPRELAVRVVPWLGFGAALPAAALATGVALCGHRLGAYLLLVLGSFVPTLLVIFSLLPLVRKWSARSKFVTDRDRGVLPIATLGMGYATAIYFLVRYNPLRGGGWAFITHVLGDSVRALLPVTWPQHLMAVAAACFVLRIWFGWTRGALEDDKLEPSPDR